MGIPAHALGNRSPRDNDEEHDSRNFAILYSMLDTLHNSALPFRTDLLCPLERDKGELEIMRHLL